MDACQSVMALVEPISNLSSQLLLDQSHFKLRKQVRWQKKEEGKLAQESEETTKDFYSFWPARSRAQSYNVDKVKFSHHGVLS